MQTGTEGANTTTTETTTDETVLSGGAGAAGADGKTGDGKTETTTTTAAGAEGEKGANTDGKTADGKTAPGADSAIELKLPEGFRADDAGVAEFKGIAKELGLDSAKAQKVFDVYAKAQTAAVSQAMADLVKDPAGSIAVVAEANKKAWLDALKADKDVGGANFEATKAAARKAMAKFGDKELDAFLTASGLGNNPLWVKFATRVGKAISEDSVAGTNGTATGKPDANAQLRARYPSMFKE